MRSRIHPLWPTWLIFVGLAIILVGERLAGSEPNITALALGTACLAAATLTRGLAFRGASRDRRYVTGVLFTATAGALVAIGVYVLIRFAFVGEGALFERLRGVLWVVFPVLIAVSLASIIAVEAAVLPVAFIERYEQSHVRRAFHRGLGLSLLLACLFVANYLAVENDQKTELSRGHQVSASDVTLTAVRELTQPMEIVLFWPRANEVADRVERYFEVLVRQNANLTLRRVDHALASTLAKETNVTENGHIALIRDQSREKIRIGTELENARSNLRRLDRSFLEALIRVSSSDKIAYFTVGHQERSWAPDREDVRPPIRLLKRQLEAWQYRVRTLGIADGLSTEIPSDAGIIFIIGPEKPFLPAEIDTIARAVDRGARVVIALEAERDGDPLYGLLGPLGLRFDKTVLVNERRNAPMTRTIADNAYIWSNNYSSHESVTTVTRFDRLATLLHRAGSLERTEAEDTGPIKTEVVLRAMDDTFRDVNNNLVFDRDVERKESFALAAAVTRTSTAGPAAEGRVFVIANSDVLADNLLQVSEGNAYLLRDIVLWLQRKAEPVVPTVSEADKKIQHRREEDTYLFYGTTFGLPLLIIGAGLGIVERRRRRR